jgi:hypothetical protein
VALSLVVLWRARIAVAPSLDTGEPAPPTMEAFVASISTLYARSRDYDQVRRAYREFTWNQLRRSFLLPPDVPRERIEARLLAVAGVVPRDLAPLLDPRPCRDRTELLEAVAGLDGLIQRVAG